MIQQQLITMEACFPTALRCCRPGHVPFLRPPSADLQHTIRSVLLWSAGGGTDTKNVSFCSFSRIKQQKSISLWDLFEKFYFFFSITRAWKWILLFTDLQIRENFGQFLHGNWNNKLRREKRLEKYIVLNFSGQLTLNEPVLKWMQPINLSRDTFYCCMCSPAANTRLVYEACYCPWDIPAG